ncbi:MAG: hypothetical protein K2Z81_15640, partial [Cyanobacteria bacterium]|nr:hypothetical protein [Cyanobacteriota bacterium]
MKDSLVTVEAVANEEIEMRFTFAKALTLAIIINIGPAFAVENTDGSSSENVATPGHFKSLSPSRQHQRRRKMRSMQRILIKSETPA